MRKSIPAILIAGTQSGCGKTSVALGLMAAFRQRGLAVAPFKAGPDFIDPGYHEAVCKRPSCNLDTWMNNRETVRKLFSNGCRDADVAVIEGVMGLFDGAGGRNGPGSAADLAKTLDVPVLLVVDGSRMSASIAALVKGFMEHDQQINFAGLLVNQVASHRHEQIVREALNGMNIGWCAFLPRDRKLKIPSRHLGLVTVHDQQGLDRLVLTLASWIERHADLDGLLARLDEDPVPLIEPVSANLKSRDIQDGPLIGIARDEAFCFYYQSNLDLFEACGARLAFYSPLRESRLPKGVQALYFGGGYPELHAMDLAKNRSILDDICRASRLGMPIYGECGGFMYLSKGLIDEYGRRFPWAGIFPFWIRMEKRFQALGYREVFLKKTSILGEQGIKMRGHEFHYSKLISGKDEPVPEQIYEVRDANGRSVSSPGWVIGNTLGSYIHLHFASCPESVRQFVAKAGGFSKSGFRV